MIISAPNYGNALLCFKVLFDGLKIPYILPPNTGKEALELGVSHSPEGICQPFKVMLGTYIQSIQKGADTILLLATNGPCKFGEYATLQERLLKKAGYDIKFIILPTYNGKKALLKEAKKLTAQSPLKKHEKYIAIIRALHAMILLDYIESKLRYISGYEEKKGESKKLLNSCIRDVYKAETPKQAIKKLLLYKKRIKDISIDLNKKPLRIAIIGEIYTISDSYSNKYIEDQLMEQGVCISRSLTPSWWLKDALFKSINFSSISLRNASKAYLSQSAGGYTRETIGKALVCQKKGYDGAVQIFPIGCTPEIIAKPILEKISSDKSFPILTLVIDEMTGDEGFNTRVEAFVDLLERRREQCII